MALQLVPAQSIGGFLTLVLVTGTLPKAPCSDVKS